MGKTNMAAVSVQENSRNASDESKARRNVFRRAYDASAKYFRGALLGAALGLGVACATGCGDTIINNYYSGADAGTKQDSTPAQQDSGPKPDSGACTVDKSCTVTEEKVLVSITPPQGMKTIATLKEGESTTVSGATVKVKNVDETVAADTCAVTDKKVTLEIQNPGTTIVTLSPGETSTVSGTTYGVPVVSVGVNGLNCSSSNNLVEGIINQGESLSVGKYKVVMDDGQQVGSVVYALLSVTDSCGNIITKLKVPEGQSEKVTLDGQSVEVKAEQVAVGLTFGAKWAKVSAKLPCETIPCSTNTAPLQCSDYNVLVSGVLNQGESFPIPANVEPYKYRLVLDDGQVQNGINNAIVSLTDGCGIILKKDKIAEGSTKEFVIGADRLDVKVNSAAFGVTFGAKWADFTIKSPCTVTYWCPAVAGILNQGESVIADNLKFQLDDLMTQNGVPYALLSVLDANGNILTKQKIAEGSSSTVVVSGKTYMISVKTVAPGYTFGAKWADIAVLSESGSPCGSP